MSLELPPSSRRQAFQELPTPQGRPESPAPGDRLLGVHGLSETEFDELAAGVDNVAVLRRLAASERSHRRVVLRALLDEAARHQGLTGPLASMGDAWGLLTSAEAVDARAAATVVDYPLTGVWATLLLRRLCGARHEDAPLWVEAGGLHLLAAAAAVRAGIPFRLAVPLRHGAVVLPTLGLARLPYRDPWEVAVVSAAAGEVRVTGHRGEVAASSAGARPEMTQLGRPAGGQSDPASPVAPWLPPVTVGAAHAGVRIDVVLDDVDPYRRITPTVVPVPLREAELERWRAVVDAGWALLVRDHPAQARAVAAVLQVIVPMASSPRFLARSATSGDAFGAALLSEPDDATQLAVTLVHELQHAKLGALGHLVDMHHADGDDRLYAPWREDPRPLGAVLQGIVAFFGVTGFWRRRRQVASGAAAGLAHFEFALWRTCVGRALTEVRDRPELTALGHRFLSGVATTLDGWLTEPVPTGPRRLARAAAVDHYAGWRLHHHVPARSVVEGLTAAWAAGDAAPAAALLTAPALVGDPTVSGLETRAVLMRHQLSDTTAVASWRGRVDLGDRVRGAVQADLDWLLGNPSAAIAGFDRVLEDVDPGDPHAWAGLGIAVFDLGDLAAARALARVPELVRALHRALAAAGRAPDRLKIARWLGAAL